jgi:transcriptional regulator with XRE-family HTH domain
MTTTAQPTDKARATGGWIYRLIRGHLGLSQQDVAALAGVSRSQYGAMERGDIGISTSTLRNFARIADALARVGVPDSEAIA